MQSEGKARRMMTADLLLRAQAGDGEAFRELTESHRRELQVHCYRMLPRPHAIAINDNRQIVTNATDIPTS
jgi:DNA-directed RNA polymerase specialized sigma24 family protein